MPEFNFKSPIITRKVRETELILEEVIPSPFFIEKELKDINIVEAEAARIKIIQSFYERRGYAQISTDLLNYITNNSKSVVIVKLICYIAKTIKFNSNKIILKENDETKKICSFIHFHRYIKELEANNIIRRTTKQSVYVVNHEMIFKGSYSDFIKVYLDIYKEVGIMLDADGRVILDKSINYGKQ
jgi:hypothetical protein